MTNYNSLKKVKDEQTIFSLLSGVKDNDTELYVWRMVGNTKHLAQVRIESVRKLRKDYCIVPADGQDRLVQDVLGGQTHIDIYVPDAALLMRCTIKSTDAPYRYYLTIPTQIVQVERRKYPRINVYDDTDVKVSFGKSVIVPRQMSQYFLKNCYDVSSGGFSFFVSRLESRFFTVNDSLPLVELKCGNWTTRVVASVAAIREIEPDEYNGFPYKVWRISCRFNNIDQVSRKYLERFIFEKIKGELHAINE